MSSAENEPVALWSRVKQASDGLRALPVEERAHAIARACAVLSTPDAALLRQLSLSAGLSEPMTRWALATTFAAFNEAALLELMRSLASDGAAKRASGVAAVLAGNVLTAAARPMLLPLLAGVPVVAKASSRDDALPYAIAHALSATHPVLGAACAVASFSHDDTARLSALLTEASCIQVLGSDDAVQGVREHVRSDQTLIARGHGLGLGLALSSSAESAHVFALDIAAYDQRGCLSPHAILVQGDDSAAEAFAQLLFEALARLERELPRGTLPVSAAAEQLQWRGVAAARGVLHARDAFAVSCEHGAALRPSPGYRNVSVYSLSSTAALTERIAPFARFLKAVGISGPSSSALAALAPYTCQAGTMQTPPLSAHLDGLHPLAGFA